MVIFFSYFSKGFFKRFYSLIIHKLDFAKFFNMEYFKITKKDNGDFIHFFNRGWSINWSISKSNLKYKRIS